jgi:hypothetical protein
VRGLRVKFVALLGTPKRSLCEGCESHVLRYTKIAFWFCLKLFWSASGWSGNASRRRREILAMVANTDKGCLASSNKNVVTKVLI